jgi:hypothetical protein
MSASRRVLGVLAVILVACNSPGVAHYTAALDAMATPGGWSIAKTTVNDCVDTIVTDCPVVIRYYVTDTTRRNAYREAQSAVADADFTIEREFNRSCDDPDGFCAFVSSRDGDEISVNVFDRGRSDDVELNSLDRVTVRAISRPS